MSDPYILTASGRRFYFLHPEDSEFDIDDIALALSKICRFTGHVKKFYSVAQHSVLVSTLVPPEHVLAGLLHDAAEAFMGDMNSPLKSLLPDFKRLESRVESAIRERFGLPTDLPREVKHADLIALATERRDLMPFEPDAWPCLAGVHPDPERIFPWAPDYAGYAFLERFHQLKGS